MIRKLFYLLIPILTFFCIQTVNAGTFTDIWDTTGYTYNEFYWERSGTLNSKQSAIFEFLKRDNSYNSAGTYTFTWFLSFNSQRSDLVCNNSQYNPETGLETCIGYTISTTSGRISSQFSLSAENCSTNLASSDNGVYIFNSSCQVADSTVNNGIIDIIVTSNANINIDYKFGLAYRYGFYPKDTSQAEIKQNTDIINSNVNDIKDSISSSDTSGSQSELENVNNKFNDDISKSPISDLINLPLKLLTAFNNKLSSNQVCTPYDMGTIFGVHWLQLPCINPPDYLGPVLWATIDMITTALLLWSIAHKMIKVYISISTVDGQLVTKIVSQTGGML